MTRARQALTGGVLAVALLVMGAGFPAERVPPKKWATSVCSAVGTWVDGAQQGADEMSAAASAAPGGDVRIIRRALVSYLADTAAATGEVGNRLEHAGTPDTPKGEKATQGLQKGFRRTEAAIIRLRREAKDVPTKNRIAAVAALRRLQARVETEFRNLDGAFQQLDKLDPGHQLSRAFKAARACRSVQG